MSALVFRPEAPGDARPIFELTRAAFDGMPYADGNEADIVDALRDAGALTLSLVGERDGAVVAHAAYSPVTIDDRPSQWLVLGPVSVSPALQRKGIGQALMRHSLDRVERDGAHGVVLLGDPNFYARFGFRSDTGLYMPGQPSPYFMALHFAGPAPAGRVRFHPAFFETPRSA